MLRYYEPLEDGIWKGRVDDIYDRDSFRWHQVVELMDIEELERVVPKKDSINFCFIGFCCDVGVDMNLGRTGASKGPNVIRRQMSTLPFGFDESVFLYDLGNIVCINKEELASAQYALATAVAKAREKGMTPIVLGGGHETAYGNYHGVKNSVEDRANVGIINFDAHFDMRPYHNGANSGTMFKQICDENLNVGNPFNYMVLGIQRYGNTNSLFKQADDLGVNYIMADDMRESDMLMILNKLHGYLRTKSSIHLTICTDVFSSAFAPGVSAPQPFGIDPRMSMGLLKSIIKSGKVASVDIAEISPRFDDDNITSKLASILIFEMVLSFVKVAKDEV